MVSGGSVKRSERSYREKFPDVSAERMNSLIGGFFLLRYINPSLLPPIVCTLYCMAVLLVLTPYSGLLNAVLLFLAGLLNVVLLFLTLLWCLCIVCVFNSCDVYVPVMVSCKVNPLCYT